MFTVMIAEKKHIDKINEYELFLRPFLTSGDVAFCQWDPEAEHLADMLPTLGDVVGRRKEWRALIVCNDAGIGKQNPFDLVTNLPSQFTGSIRGKQDQSVSSDSNTDSLDESGTRDLFVREQDLNNVYSEEYKAFLQAEHEKKLRAYDEAAQNPLTRLVTFFCNAPTITKQGESAVLGGDPDYARYIAENQYKQELRNKILGDEQMETSQPKEVLCVAKRTYTSAEKEFDAVWSVHTEMEYSRFYDRNMYFDKMRYLVFDILPSTQRDYMFDYIRFLYATILLASNEVPSGCLTPERVYKLECENDENALRTLLQTYEAKLDLTKETLNGYIQQIREKKPHVLSDQEAKILFCVNVDQPVTLDSEEFRQTELYAKHSKIGLADGCSQDEAILWEGEYKNSQKALTKMLKQSRRALRRVANQARSQQDTSFDRVELLNEFQLEDIRAFVDNQELAMLNVPTVDLYNEEVFTEQMADADKQVQEKIETRMYKKTTITLGAIACLMFVLGFFTLFIQNANTNAFNFTTSLIITLVGLGTFALVALITLFFLRGGLVAKFKSFNNTMHDIGIQVYGAMTQYSKYLSYMSNMRRGYAVMEAVERKENPDHGKIILYTKHITDIENAKAEVREVFGQFMVNKTDVDTENLNAYSFNFDAPVDYKYPLPYSDGTARKITFIQTGIQINVPVEFVKQITVRREELYE